MVKKFTVSFTDERGDARREDVFAFDRAQALNAFRRVRPLCTGLSCGETGEGQSGIITAQGDKP